MIRRQIDTDVTFVVGRSGARIRAHRLIVSLRCPTPILHQAMAEGRSGAEVTIAAKPCLALIA